MLLLLLLSWWLLLFVQSKHLQFLSGVKPTTYWFSALAWDLFSAVIPVVLTLVVVRISPIVAYHGTSLTALFLVLVSMWVSHTSTINTDDFILSGINMLGWNPYDIHSLFFLYNFPSSIFSACDHILLCVSGMLCK